MEAVQDRPVNRRRSRSVVSDLQRLPRELRLRTGRTNLRMRYALALMSLDRQEWPRQLPVTPWQGNAGQGKRIIDGTFEFNGTEKHFATDFWQNIGQSDIYWLKKFYDFRWLADVAACDRSEKAAETIRNIIVQWSESESYRSPVSRHPDIVGERLANWFCYQDFLLKGASDSFKRLWLKHQYHAVLQLERVRNRKREKTSFSVLKGLIYAALALPSASFLTPFTMRSLLQAMQLRFLEDGGHVSRSPSWHADELRSLMEIRNTLQVRRVMIPPQMDAALQRMLDAMATVMHPDGTLAMFHDTVERDVSGYGHLWQSWGKPHPQAQQYLPEFRFVHITKGQSNLIMDVGVPVPELSRSFYGTLSFELMNEGERIITNCGGYRGSQSEWRKACKSTAAHSTLSLDDVSSWQNEKEANYTLLHTPEVSCDLKEKDGTAIVDAAYNGYVPYAGLVHYRKLSLAKNGKKLEGVDVLTPHASVRIRDTHRVQIRFHLHPDMTITRIARGKIEMKTKTGREWVFETSREFAAGVEESVYLGKDGKPKKSLQLVIESMVAGNKDVQIHWILSRAK